LYQVKTCAIQIMAQYTSKEKNGFKNPCQKWRLQKIAENYSKDAVCDATKLHFDLRPGSHNYLAIQKSP